MSGHCTHYDFTGSIVPGDGTSDGAAYLVRSRFAFSVNQACAIFAVGPASFVQRKLVPSTHIRCRTIANLRASATLARFKPRRFATSMAQRFKAENRVTRDKTIFAAS